jgi:hypothetical protein
MISEEYIEPFRQGLFSGQYNLLLGSGVSLDSTDRYGSALKSVSTLTKELCLLKGLDSSTKLQRISLLLEPHEIDKYLTKPYSNSRPGETVKRLTSFVWRSIYTFNIDDALEAAYESSDRSKQKVESLNYDALFKTQPSKEHLSLVHLHGFVREPEKGYVFSTSQYAQVTRGMCAWMHVLSELIASEPFIISGTSLDESDLEFYLSGRTSNSARANRGPSFLVEPYPNKITDIICRQHGLILVKSTLAEFLKWISERLGHAPSVAQLTIPSLDGIFRAKPIVEEQLKFFSCFDLVTPVMPNPEGDVPAFYFGKLPRWSDLETSIDIPSDDERSLFAKARNWLSGDDNTTKILNVNAETGSGKSTIIRRVGYDLTKEGFVVFCLNFNEAIDSDNASYILSLIHRPTAIIIDGLADHAPSLRSVIANVRLQIPLVIISADRDYRYGHIDRVLGDLNMENIGISMWKVDAYEKLINILHRVGLLSNQDAVHTPRVFAAGLIKDPVAIAMCRAINNFRPLEAIINSLWRDSNTAARHSYAVVALVAYCYPGGVFYPILEKAYHNSNIKEQLDFYCPLPLSYMDEDYIIPLHPIVAERLLHMLSRDKQVFLLEVFSTLANALAPYVNRGTIIARTPESKLAARLFSADKVVRPLLGEYASDFFLHAREAWQWNSRYWEQRALLTQSSDLDLAIQYARHAVAIEAHPFPWTTLASLLTKKLEIVVNGYDAIYSEVIDILLKVIKFESESRSWKPTPHPYSIVFHATESFLNKGGRIMSSRREWIEKNIEYCSKVFSRDETLNNCGDRILEILRKI